MIISNATVSRRKLPCNLIEDDRIIFDRFINKDIKEAKLLTFEDASIGWDGIIFKGSHIYKESIHYDVMLMNGLDRLSIRTLKFYCKFYLNNFLFKTDYALKDDDYLWIVDRYSWSYFHWFCDAIPKLYAVTQLIEPPKLLLPKSYQKFSYVLESLKVFPTVEAIFIPDNSCCQVKRLLFPTSIAQSGHYNDALMQQIRIKFREYFARKPSISLGEKIYISRANAGRRKIINEEDLISLLNRYGFKDVILEDFSFADQASIILNAKYLISNHGAGLTNMLFMEAGSSILELRRQGDYFNNCYFSLASALDIKYYYQTCKTDSVSDNLQELTLSPNLDYTLKDLQNFSAFTHNGNIIVDLDRLESILQSKI